VILISQGVFITFFVLNESDMFKSETLSDIHKPPTSSTTGQQITLLAVCEKIIVDIVEAFEDS